MERSSAVRSCVLGLFAVLACTEGSPSESREPAAPGDYADFAERDEAPLPSAVAEAEVEYPAEEPAVAPEGYVAADQAMGASAMAGGTGRAAAALGGQGAPRIRRRVPAAPRVAALPQNGVLASTFVGGSGVTARLDDLLDRGVLVSGERIRLQAFEDRDPLPYPRPARDAMAMFAELERTRVSADGDTVHLQIALVGREGEAPARPAMDVRLVLDRSGSMSGMKWLHAKEAAHALVNRMRPEDRFALVSYADDARIDFAPHAVGNGAEIHQVIDALEPGGGTNIEAGLRMAAENPPQRRGARDLGMVLLISDGQATVGQTSPTELGSIARATFDSHGVLTTAIGLGTDFDERTMLEIAREGSGSYHFVRRSEDVEEVLQNELEDRAQAVAQALRVRVELADGVTARRVYGSRLLGEAEHAAVRHTEVATDARIARELGITRTRQREEESGLRVHLPTFRRGDQHVILMELEVPAGRSALEVATVTLDYKDLISERNGRVVRDVGAERGRDAEQVAASIRRPVKRTVLAFQAGEALQNAATALGRGDSAQARRLLSEQRELLEAAADLWRDPALGEDAQRLARYERVLGGAWDGWGGGERRTLVMAMNYFGDRRMR